MLRKVATSYWTTGALGFVAILFHGWWLTLSDHAGEVLSGFGASILDIGLLVAARPFMRTGITGLARQQVPPPEFPAFFNSVGLIDEIRADHAEKVAAAIPDVWAERVVAVVVIAIGTLLNGYGTPIARLLDLRI